MAKAETACRARKEQGRGTGGSQSASKSCILQIRLKNHAGVTTNIKQIQSKGRKKAISKY